MTRNPHTMKPWGLRHPKLSWKNWNPPSTSKEKRPVGPATAKKSWNAIHSVAGNISALIVWSCSILPSQSHAFPSCAARGSCPSVQNLAEHRPAETREPFRFGTDQRTKQSPAQRAERAEPERGCAHIEGPCPQRRFEHGISGVSALGALGAQPKNHRRPPQWPKMPWRVKCQQFPPATFCPPMPFLVCCKIS